jgi:uncharacterized protein YqjF (DUF2071 family)
VNLNAGSYTLSFRAAQRLCCVSPYVQPIKVTVDGVQIGALISPQSTSFAAFSVSFVISTAGAHTIAFTGTDTADKTTFIDAVTLAAANLGPTTTALSSSLNPSTSGSRVTLTATVTGSNPTGSVNFADGVYSIGCDAVAVTGAGNTRTASCSLSNLLVGTHTIVATYGGDGSNAASASAPLTQVVNSGVSSSLLNGGFEIPALGSGYQYSPSAAGVGWTFSGGSGIEGNGSAFGAASAPDGTQAAFIQSAGSIAQTVNLNAGSYTLSFRAAQRLCCVSPYVQPIKVTVDGVQIGALISPQSTSFAAFSVSFVISTAGAHTIAFTGTDTADKTTFIDAVTLAAANLGPTTTALSSSLNPSTSGSRVTLTATVTGSNPTGSVNFADGVYSIGCDAVAVTGAGNTRTASCSLSNLLVGTHTIVATYGGDGSNAASASAPLTQVVNSGVSSSLLNGGFEIPALGSGYQYSPSAAGVGWTFSGGSGIEGNGSAFGAASAPDGTQAAFIQSAGSIAQTVNLNAGSYTLSFRAAQRLCCVSPYVQPIKVTVDGVQIGALISPQSTSFAAFSVSFVISTAGAHTIAFTGTDTADKTTFIDAVTLAAANLGPTTTALSSSLNPSTSGSRVTLTATVTGSNPTGSVNFADGVYSIGCDAVAVTGAGNTRTASCSLSNLLVGTHTIVATYGGDGSNAASASAPLTQVVNSGVSSSLLNGGFEIPALGSGYQYSPSAAGVGWTFSGGSGIEGNGSAFGAASAPDGTQAAFIQSAGSIAQTVNLNAGSYTLSFRAAQRLCCVSPYVQPIKVTVDGVQIGALISPQSTSFAAFSVSFVISTAGAHTIAFTGTDTADKTTFIDAVTLAAANLGPTTTALSSSLNPSTSGSRVTLTATVTGSNPTGSVNFADGVYSIGCDAVAVTGAGNTRTASCSLSNLLVGTHTIVATYGGDGSNAASASAPLTQVVNSGVSSSLLNGGFEIPALGSGYQYSPSAAGVGWTFSGGSGIEGNGSAFGAASAPDGTQAAFIQSAGSIAQTVNLNAGSYTLSFRAAQRLCCVSPYVQPIKVTVDGVQIGALISPQSTSFAAFSVSFVISTAGAHTIAFTGTDTADKTTFIDAVTLAAANLGPTTTALSSSLNPSTSGSRVTLTATVTGSNPTGSVNFADGIYSIGCGAVAVTGAGNTRTASCSLSNFLVGTHTIVATYSGDGSNAASSSAALAQVVNAGVTSSATTLISSPNPSTTGANVTFTATVSGTAPTGSVNFKDGGVSIGGCSASSLTGAGNSRSAACSTNALTVGTHNIVATYSGDIANTSSSSGGLSQTVNTTGSTNVALASNGGVASASSTYSAAFPVSAINDNERAGANYSNGGYWNDGTPNSFPDWVQINFNGSKTIDHVVVYSVQDNYTSPVEPSDTQTFSLYGITDFTVQGWNGSAWVTLATVSGNNLVKRTVTFSSYTTDRVRINVTNALNTWSRITEVEAWGVSAVAPTNVALASSGAVALASSTYSAGYPVSAVNNNERAGVNWGNGGGWADGTLNVYPDWVQIIFNGTKTIDHAVVYSVQDNWMNPIEPTDTQTFALYGVTDFTVFGWDGSTWVSLGSVSGNNLVKRTVAFSPYTTDRILIYVTGALASSSRITEVEAWGY